MMRRPDLLRTGRGAAAVAALLAAAALLGAAAWRAARLEPLPGPEASTPAPRLVALAPPVDDSGGARDEELDNDPFDPDRQLPQTADDADASANAADTAPPVAPPMIRLLGTVIRADGRSFAVYQLPSEPPRMIRVGERIGTLTLVAVEPGRAVFRAAGGDRVELHLATTGT